MTPVRPKMTLVTRSLAWMLSRADRLKVRYGAVIRMDFVRIDEASSGTCC
jgi:hypothetical protein